MRKRVFCVSAFLLATVFCTAILAGCNSGKKGGEPIIAKTASQLYQEVLAVSGFGNMTAVPNRDYMDIYGIDSARIEDSAWYMSENPSLNGDEAAIFRAVDEDYASQLEAVFKSRIERQKQVAETYSPAELAKYQKTQITRVGNWVYYVVGDNYTNMMNVLRDAIGG